MDDAEERIYRNGTELLAAWNCDSRESKLERACLALLQAIEELHVRHEQQSLLMALHPATTL
jgi:hypothetical protein